MTVVFDGEIQLRAGTWSLAPPVTTSTPGGLDRAFANQSQALLDLSGLGRLTAVTGTLRGAVPLHVEVLDAAPPVVPSGDDVVEGSLTHVDTAVVIVDGTGRTVARLPLVATSYRVRYGVSDLDTGRERQVRRADEPTADRCWMQLWPALPVPDRVVQIGGQCARAWHEAVRNAPHVPTAEEREATAAAEEARWQARYEAEQQAAELARWGGRVPDATHLDAARPFVALAATDRDLVDTLVDLPDDDARRLSIELLAALSDRTGLAASTPTVADALDDLRAGRPAPPPFDWAPAAWEATGGPAAPRRPAPDAETETVTGITGASVGASLAVRWATPADIPTTAQRVAMALGDVGTDGRRSLASVMRRGWSEVPPALLVAMVHDALARVRPPV